MTFFGLDIKECHTATDRFPTLVLVARVSTTRAESKHAKMLDRRTQSIGVKASQKKILWVYGAGSTPILKNIREISFIHKDKEFVLDYDHELVRSFMIIFSLEL